MHGQVAPRQGSSLSLSRVLGTALRLPPKQFEAVAEGASTDTVRAFEVQD